jgi:sulfate permease, SulP family
MGSAKLLQEMLPNIVWRDNVDGRSEMSAGLAGAILAIPQAITFAYLAGVPPEHGLYCAIFVGFLSSLFGSSALVGGPNTAVSILIGLTVISFAGRGSPLFIEFVLILSMMVGFLQLLIWLARGAELFRYFSPAAIAGIKVGVGVLLITSGVEGALGMSPLTTHYFYEKFYLAGASWCDVVNVWAVSISAMTVVMGLWLRRHLPRAYVVLAMVAGGFAGALVYATLGPVASQIELLGHVRLHPLPLTLPTIGAPQVLFLEQTFSSALAIAVLGLAQTLVIARDLKISMGGEIDLHKETFAQGFANILAPFFNSFAGSGSFNRTNVAVEMGARTPLSGMVAAIAIVIVAWLMEPILTWLPMPTIAGVMVLVGFGMMQNNDFRLLSIRTEAIVFVATLLSVIFLGLETGILVAVIVSIGFFVASASRVGLAISITDNVERITVKGNLFYASLDRLAKHLRRNPARRTVLDLSKVAYCDSAAWALIHRIQAERRHHGGQLEITSPP